MFNMAMMTELPTGILLLILTILRMDIFAEAACGIDSTVMTFKEDVPKDTVISKIPRVKGEKWSFKEEEPNGYIGFAQEPDLVVIYFKQTPNLEEINKDRSQIKESLSFTLECKYKGWKHVYKQTVMLLDINEYDPIYTNTEPLKVQVPEDTPNGSKVLNLRNLATDVDVTGRIVGYDVHRSDILVNDGFDYFKLSTDANALILNQSVDFEEMENTVFILNISAYDNGQPEPRRSYTTIHISIEDTDDQGPVFVYNGCPVVDGYCAPPVYHTSITTDHQGLFTILPDTINAVDKDRQNNTIIYSIIEVNPEEFTDHFQMSETTGEMQIIKPLQNRGIHKLIIVVQATEDSVNQRSLTTNLEIIVKEHSQLYPNEYNNADHHIEDVFNVHNRKINKKNNGSVSFSIFLSTVGMFLVIIGVVIIVFIKYFKDRTNSPDFLSPSLGIYSKSNQPLRPVPPPPPHRTSSAQKPSSLLCSKLDPMDLYMSCDYNSGSSSPASSRSSVNIDYDDAITFVTSKCQGSNITAVPFSCEALTHFGSDININTDENVGQILKRKMHNMFRSRGDNSPKNTRSNTGPRFDIRSLSSFS